MALVKLCQFKPCEDLAGHALVQYFCDLFLDFMQNYRIQILKGDINKSATSLIPVDLHQCNPEVNLALFLETILSRGRKRQGTQKSKSKPDSTFNLKYDYK